MTNAQCDAIYGIIGDGIICIDTEGGRGTCNVSSCSCQPFMAILDLNSFDIEIKAYHKEQESARPVL